MEYNFTYKIESYNQAENKIFVLYYPEDPSLPVLGEYFSLLDNMLPEDVDAMVTNLIPVSRWINYNKNNNVLDNIGSIIGTSSAPKKFVESEPVPPKEPTPEELEIMRAEELAGRKRAARKLRNFLLEKTDFTQLPDFPNDVTKVDWSDYRQQLRDLPETEGFPDSDLPTAPDVALIDLLKQQYSNFNRFF